MLLADVDGFKGINDSRGHAAGDDVLRSVAGVLRAVSPAHGRAFRIGGDEFAMLFECSRRGRGAGRSAGTCRRRRARRLGTTMSIGLAIAGRAESDEQLVARADAALYEVKRRGRDGVLLAPAASADDERVGRALDRHALEPALADLAVHVELGAVRQLDLDHAPAVVLDRLLLLDRAAAQAPRAAGQREPRAGGQDRDVELAVARVGDADLRAAAERAAGGDDQLPGATLEAVAPSTRTRQRSGASVAAARSAPTP